MNEQLRLDVEPPLLVIARAADGTVCDVIPVQPGESLGPASAWAYLAIKEYEKLKASGELA